MKIGMISFTKNGYLLGEYLKAFLIGENHEVWTYTKSRYLEEQKAVPLKESLQVWTKNMFEQAEAIIFIGACGIAVRSIAPYVKDKRYDPAVLVLDEKGKFCISLLSGHLGGANELTEKISAYADAIPVITTATDVNEVFAVDVFAKKNKLQISNMTYAKEISAALLLGETIRMICEPTPRGQTPLGGQTPPRGLTLLGDRRVPVLGIYVGIYRKEKPFLKTLYLTPKVVTIGIGCRKNTSMEQIEKAVEKTCLELGISFKSIEQVASIDLKQKEPGILAYCEKYRLPFLTYSSEKLKEVRGSFTASAFVKKTTGVENVCERSAVLASSQGTIIKRKTAENGVTVAIAVRDWSVEFE